MLACETYLFYLKEVIMEINKPLFGNLYTTVYGRTGGVLIITNGLDSNGEELSYYYIYNGSKISHVVKTYEGEWYNGYEEYPDDISDIVEIVDTIISDKVYNTLKSLDFMNLDFDEKIFIACNQR